MTTRILTIGLALLPITLHAQFFTISPMKSTSPLEKMEIGQNSITSADTVEIVTSDTVPRIDMTEAHLATLSESPSLAWHWCHPPLRGKLRVTSHYGQRRNPFDGTQTEYHSGLDLAAPQGTPIYTMLPGEVLAVGYTDRAGNYIKLKHGNIIVTYCHLLRQPSIPHGTHLLPGTPIAQVGTTGRSTAPHLHISVKISNRPIDPILLLRLLKIL